MTTGDAINLRKTHRLGDLHSRMMACNFPLERVRAQRPIQAKMTPAPGPQDQPSPTTDVSAATHPTENRREVVRIGPRSRWQLVDLRELIRYSDLLFFLVKRDLHVVYKQTVLGFGWAIIQPVFAMVVFTIVFGKMARVPSDGIPYPIFSYAALVPWTYFSTAVTSSTTSLVSQANIITKVYFPRLLVPLTPILAKGVNFAIALLVLFVMMVAYKTPLTPAIALLPVLIILLALSALAMGVWLSALAIQYRDIRYVSTFLVQIMMYAAPVVWPASLVPDRYRLLYGLYPMAGIIEGFRACLLGRPLPWDLLGMGSIAIVIVLATGLAFFRRVEDTFADVV